MKALLAEDGSPHSKAASSLLGAIAKRDNLAVTVLTVASLGSETPDWPPPYLEAAVEQDRNRAQCVANDAAEWLRRQGFVADTQTAAGHPGLQIVQAAVAGHYDLILLGNGRHHRLSSLLLGSTGDYVLHGSPLSVLLVHEPPRDSHPHRVLVTTDGSPGAEFAAGVLGAIADPQRCRCAVLCVTDLPPRGEPGDYPLILHAEPPVPFSAEDYDQIVASRRAWAEEKALVTASTLRQAGFEVDVEIATGSPRSVILEDAAQGNFDLVVAGSRGLGPVRRALMGSVSEPVAHHARAALIGRREPTPQE